MKKKRNKNKSIQQTSLSSEKKNNQSIADRVSARLNECNPMVYKINQCRKEIHECLKKKNPGIVQGVNDRYVDKAFSFYFQNIENQETLISKNLLVKKSQKEKWANIIETTALDTTSTWEKNKNGEWVIKYISKGQKLFDYNYWIESVLSLVFEKYTIFYNELHPMKNEQVRTYKLYWTSVIFGNGYMIYAPEILENEIRVAPLQHYNKDLKESYNYLREYLQKKLPDIKCTVREGKLYLVDILQLDNAILKIKENKDRWLQAIESDNTRFRQSIYKFSFKDSCTQSVLLTPEFFKKYKSLYIDALVEKQIENYRIVPVVERLEHYDSRNDEEGFLFTIETSDPEKVCVVLENVNPARSSILFYTLKEGYKKTLHNIFDFICSAEINKRSKLHSNSYLLSSIGVLWYRCVNHDFNWRYNMRF